MVALTELPALPDETVKGARLVNSRFPPIALFDDVADADEFDALYQVQALTNPRLQTEIGNLGLLAQDEIPFGIPGCAYATAPFTHVNPAGSRFGDGTFGVLYVADDMETALAEVTYHQRRYWSQVPALNYERFVFRGLSCTFRQAGMLDACSLPMTDALYASEDYSAAQSLGRTLKHARTPGLRYHSVRRPGSRCWAVMTPRVVTAVRQTTHFEMVWNDGITAVNRFSQV